MSKNRDILVLICISVTLILLSVWSLTVGEVNIPIDGIINVLKGKAVENGAWSFIVEDRLNRTIMAFSRKGERIIIYYDTIHARNR